MERFSNSWKPHEEVVIQRYVDKYAIFYSGSIIVYYLCAIAVVLIIPIVLHQPLPTIAVYPFDIYYEPVKSFVKLHQCLVGFIASSTLCLNTFAALLIFFASARFEILIEELKAFTDVKQLMKCIKKHQEIIMYATEVIIVARSYALTCICCSTVNLVIIGVSFFTDIPLIMRLKYTIMITACLAEVFMFAWPSECLLFMSNKVGDTVFYNHWYNQSAKIRKLTQTIIARSQKMVKIAIPFITQSVSMNYLTSYCSTILSYFTTLRVMMNDNEDDK